MKFKPLLGNQLSGSMAGIVASHNKGGTYFRQRSIPVNPGSEAQVAVRGVFADLAVAWRDTLTQVQRDGWDVYAENSPITDAIGEQIVLPGLAMYQRGNTARIQAGLARVDDPPDTFGFPDPPTAGLTADPVADTVDVAFDETAAWVDEDGAFLSVLLSRPQNASINFFKGPYRFADAILGNSTTPPVSPATVTAPFPFATGNRIFAQMRIGRADGRLSSPFRTSALAT